MNQPKRELIQLRADLDALIVLADQVKGSRETATAFTALQTAKLHIGNTLFELNGAVLYKENSNPTNNQIDAYHVDDVTPLATPADWNEGTAIQNVKILRRELDSILVRVKKLPFDPEFQKLAGVADQAYAYLFLTESIVKLRESQNFYGMELGRILKSSPAIAQ